MRYWNVLLPKDSMRRCTAVLGGAGLINRLIGFIYLAYLIRLAGSEPVGLYRMVIPLYFAVLTLVGAGLPYAVSKRVAEARADQNFDTIRTVCLLALTALSLTSLAGALFFYYAADWLAAYAVADPRAGAIIPILAPAIPIVSLAALLRGYFQGLCRMEPAAGAQTLEQLSHAAVTIVLAHLWLEHGAVAVAVAMAFGMVVGESIGLLVLAGTLLRQHYKPFHTLPRLGLPGRAWLELVHSDEVYHLAHLAGPAAVGNLAQSAIMVVYMVLVPSRLQTTGLAAAEATAVFGQFLGIAAPLVRFPTVIHIALILALVPNLAQGLAAGRQTDVSRMVAKAIVITFVTALPAAAFIAVEAESLAAVLFSVREAAPIIRAYAGAALFLPLRLTTNGILRGLGRVGTASRNQTIILLLDTLLTGWAVGVFPGGLTAAAVIGTGDFALVTYMNLRAVGQKVSYSVYLFQDFLAPVLACGLTAVSIQWLRTAAFTGLDDGIRLGIRLVVAALIYILCLHCLGVIRRLQST